MPHQTSRDFWKMFNDLPESIQNIARKKFELLQIDPKYPSLHFKKIGQFWSVRVSINYRAIAFEEGNDFRWVWIGTHKEYEEIIK
ncbi:MAG: hypothetical protein ABRQ38_01360 [Candidatus Eremiobacterota bacterium]